MKIELKMRMEIIDPEIHPFDLVSKIGILACEKFGHDKVLQLFPTVTLLPDDEKINNSRRKEK